MHETQTISPILKFKKIFISLITLSIILAYVASEIYLPALPQLQKELGNSISDLQITISIFVFGVAMAQFIGGPIIDRFNYRVIALGMCGIFIGASLACGLSSGLFLLIMARLAQAIAAGFLAIIGRASLTRNFTATETVRIYLFISPLLALSLSFSPFIGGYITQFLGWRFVFFFTAALGMVLLILIYFFLFVRTAPKISINFSTIIKTYARLLSNKDYSAAIIVTAVCFALSFSFLTETPFIYAKMNYSSASIGKFYILFSISFVVGTISLKKFFSNISFNNSIYLGFFITLTGLLLMFLASFLPVHSAYTIILPSAFMGFGGGILVPLGSAKALSIFPEMAGYASGFLGSSSLAVAALATKIVNPLTNGSVALLAVFISVIIISGLISFYFLQPHSIKN